MKWAYEASAVLAAHPEMAADVAKTIRSADATPRGRAFALDMLADTDHPQAQAALREVLTSTEIQNDERYSYLLQRVSMVDHPDEKTFALLHDLLRNANATTSNAALVALGSATRKIREGEENWQVDAIQQAESALTSSYSSAPPTGKEVALMAMGNAALPNLFETIIAASSNEEASLRRGAATALRHYGAEEQGQRARLRLVELVGDPEDTVVLSSLRSLMKLGFDAASRARLALQMNATTRSRPNDALLISVVNRHFVGDGRRQALSSILARSDLLPHTAGRLRTLLKR